jgi:hypothetical protein
MQRIPIKFASPGMILAKPALREDGIVLVGEGLVLTDSILEKLKSSDLSSLVVKGHPLPGLGKDMNLSKVRERMPHLFRKYEDDPFMNTMRNLLEHFLDKAIEREKEYRMVGMQGEPAQEGGSSADTASS